MVRIAAILLLLANLAYYAWTHGMLGDFAPVVEGEPHKLEQQIQPELLLITPAIDDLLLADVPPDLPAIEPPPIDELPVAEEAPAAPENTAAAPPPPRNTRCLQAGVFDAAQSTQLRNALSSWPEDSWSLESTPIAGRWMVYLGPLADEKAVAQKRSELRALGVDFDRPGLALEPGLSLGRYSSEERAHNAHATLVSKGVRALRVVVDRPASPGFTLRLPAVDSELQTRLKTLRAALGNKTLRECL